MESLFRKTISSQGYICAEKDTITWRFPVNVFMGMYFFVFTLLFQRKQKQPPEKFCEKSALKNFANFTRKYLCWSLFLEKLQAFYEHLGTTCSKKINICLIVKALLLRRIKLLNKM